MTTEKRLIDAKALWEYVKTTHISSATRVTIMCLLDIAPTVDAVEVVRCKDCKKGHPELAPNGGVWCAVWNHVFRDDEFCSKGERRGNG